MAHNIYQISFQSIYVLYQAKVEKKGRTVAELNQVICWMTGYSETQLKELLETDMNFRDFFEKAPEMNEKRILITGKICGVQIEEIQDPLMKEIRYLDKLVDELARGRAMSKILREKDR